MVTITVAAPAPGVSAPATPPSVLPPPPQPATAARSTPKPAVTAAAPAEPPASSTSATPAPPSLKEFAAIAALQNIHFDFDKHEIRPDDAKILDENATWMKANPDYAILIEGHADERGTSEYNLALGERRAKATMSYLVTQGIEADRIMPISYGKERPLCTEKNEECWAQNRRAHFLVKAP